MNNQSTLAYWIEERDFILRAKEQGILAPWSPDDVFRTVYFCNVRREDDKVTKWIRENYTMDFFKGKYDLAIVAARIFNRPDTLSRLANDLLLFSPDGLLEKIHYTQECGEQVWSGAYLISTCGAAMPKSEYCVELLKEADNLLPLTAIDTCRRAWEVLQYVNGLGSFLAAQVVADLKNTEGHQLYNALDRDTFCAPGPGSLRGMNWFFGGEPGKKWPVGQFHAGIAEIRKFLETSPAAPIVKTICNQDLQNCLCEYDKYMRVKTGTGRSKRKYNGF